MLRSSPTTRAPIAAPGVRRPTDEHRRIIRQGGLMVGCSAEAAAVGTDEHLLLGRRGIRGVEKGSEAHVAELTRSPQVTNVRDGVAAKGCRVDTSRAER